MTLADDINSALIGRQLLSHPFYQRWERGELDEGELAAYGAQYAHFERQLPHTLEAIAQSSSSAPVRDAVVANLDDELGTPCAHVELLGTFLAAVNAVEADPDPATAALVLLYATAPARSEAFALGVIAAYELQAAEIAATKGEGLRRFYGLTSDETVFWDVHATMEGDHADWVLSAAEAVQADELLAGVAASRDAWWAFLDERDAAAVPA